jgi:hypothetical protein
MTKEMTKKNLIVFFRAMIGVKIAEIGDSTNCELNEL